MGTDAKKVNLHKSFVAKLMDELNNGVGNLVDADLAKESAKLQALQTKQQLGVQALSIANQAPQTILSLFRN
jgi:flagellin